MSQVITSKSPFIQYGIHATSLPYCAKEAAYGGIDLLYLSEAYGQRYIARFNRLPRYTEMDGKTFSLYVMLSLHCIVCSTFIPTQTTSPLSGYESLTIKHSVLSDDVVYFCCSSKCKDQLEATPNIYV